MGTSKKIKLSSLSVGEMGLVEELATTENLHYRQRLLAQGVIPGVILQVKRILPLGDPIEVVLPCGSCFIVRKQEANIIRISKLADGVYSEKK
jgi:Fe2+ transport system protein FeoA